MTSARPRTPILLVIDDDLLMLKYQDAVLAAAGFSCRLAWSASTGLRDLEQHVPDAVICDYHMPGATGLDFLQWIRASPGLKHLPVGIVSSDLALPEAIVRQIEGCGGVVRTGVLPREQLVQLAHQLTKLLAPQHQSMDLLHNRAST